MAEGKAESKSPAQKVSEAVDAWFFEHVHNSPASQDQRAYNHLVSAKEALKKKVLEALS